MPDGKILYSSAGAVPAQCTNATLNLLALLLDSASAADNGVWVSFYPFNSATLDVTHSGSGTYSLQLYGSNQEGRPAAASSTVTVGGTVTVGDTVVLTVTSVSIPGGSVSVSYETVNSDTTSTVATALATAINSNSTLATVGLSASVSGAVVTVPQLGTGAIATLSNGSAGGNTETLTIATTLSPFNGHTLGSAITTDGITVITYPVRWIKAVLTVSGTVSVTATLNAVTA